MFGWGRSCGTALASLLVALGQSPAHGTPGTPEQVGLWAEPFREAGCPSGAPHEPACAPLAQGAAVLPDGRVFYYQERHQGEPSTPHQNVSARVLDLRSGSPEWTVPILDPGAGSGGLHCTDLASLPDGRLLMAGGADGGEADGRDAVGVTRAALFDARTGTVSGAGPLARGRWHPSLVTLPDGRILAAGGASRMAAHAQVADAGGPEIFDPDTGAWTGDEPAGAKTWSTPLPLEPRLHLVPDGRVFHGAAGEGPASAGADEAFLAFERFYDPATGMWETAGPAPYGRRDGAASVMLPMAPPYDQATVLTFGGAPWPDGPALGLSTLTTVDDRGRIAHHRTGDLAEARWLPSAVALPDGSVLALAGSSRGGPAGPGPDPSVRTAELYDPTTGRWTEMASPSRPRPHHHTAVLLSDGRVLLGGGFAAGGGGPLGFAAHDPTFEVFSPPYLFRGRRPKIKQAPTHLAWGQPFRILSPAAGEVESVVLLRLPSPQHGSDSDARTLQLSFSRTGSNEIEALPPPDGIAAPPGYYYLFVVSGSLRGPIPSVARIVRVGPA